MLVNHCVLITNGKKNIGRFSKIIDMPSLPPVGCTIMFGESFGGFQGVVKELTYSEKEETVGAFYLVDVLKEQDRIEDYIPDDYYPRKLVNNCGFKVDWFEEGYEGILEED